MNYQVTRTALLIPWWKPGTTESGYNWETPSGRHISGSFATWDESLKNKPDGYYCLDDGWHPIGLDKDNDNDED